MRENTIFEYLNMHRIKPAKIDCTCEFSQYENYVGELFFKTLCEIKPTRAKHFGTNSKAEKIRHHVTWVYGIPVINSIVSEDEDGRESQKTKNQNQLLAKTISLSRNAIDVALRFHDMYDVSTKTKRTLPAVGFNFSRILTDKVAITYCIDNNKIELLQSTITNTNSNSNTITNTNSNTNTNTTNANTKKKKCENCKKSKSVCGLVNPTYTHEKVRNTCVSKRSAVPITNLNWQRGLKTPN
eukprot:Pgem_evm1s2819